MEDAEWLGFSGIETGERVRRRLGDVGRRRVNPGSGCLPGVPAAVLLEVEVGRAADRLGVSFSSLLLFPIPRNLAVTCLAVVV